MVRLLAKRVVGAALGICAGLVMLPAFAHPGAHHASTSFLTGFEHPLVGWDHLLAMLAIGLWAAQQRRPVSWTLILAFPLMMAIGALAALGGMGLPMVETGIAGSVAVLGLLIAFAVRLPASVAMAIVALFAVFHGYAHGAEMPEGGSAVLYGAGFVLATVLLHFAGGVIGKAGLAAKAVRAIGIGMSMAGVYLLAGSF